jgi:hypothetical protein
LLTKRSHERHDIPLAFAFRLRLDAQSRIARIHTMSERVTFFIRLAVLIALYAPIAALFVVYWRCAVCG